MIISMSLHVTEQHKCLATVFSGVAHCVARHCQGDSPIVWDFVIPLSIVEIRLEVAKIYVAELSVYFNEVCCAQAE